MQITKDSDINDQYTIYPMHAKRIDNESAFKLYQMLKIEDVPMDNRYKYLDVNMCFLDLYPDLYPLPDYLFVERY